ncbi:RNA-directed DNA polymerase [Yersinia hibernica]|uniref:RNA-dependent DNA polymerase n=1 Tax=Yersinia enterocolitica LC20 TaxID=1443113 RepID=A0A7U4K1I3_YEREN|nr:RNA-directed DNA polymerase [Yersinia hibernica]AHM74481.1 RNA-dependent DNA polymerase [Yersinia hibernica]
MNAFSLQILTQELLQCAVTTSASLQKSLALESIAPLCQSLAYDLFHQTYQPGAYTRFAVNDPKLREIYAPLFRDRLAQCWLVSQIEPTVERQLIGDTFANRSGKGTLAAIHRVQRFMRQPQHGHFLQLDIQNFFNSIHLPTLVSMTTNGIMSSLPEHPRKACVMALLMRTILHPVAHHAVSLSGNKTLLDTIPCHKTLGASPYQTGLPLGSSASQLFANLYLSPLDHFIKHQLHVKGYVRYMDDLMLLGNSSQQLIEWREEISTFLTHTLRLTLHPTKQHLQRCSQGADYLGYKIYPHYLHLRTRNLNKIRRWLALFNYCLHPEGSPPPTKPDNPEWAACIQLAPITPDYVLLQKMQAVMNSYFGLMQKANHYRLRKKLYQYHFCHLKHWFIPANSDYTSVRIKKHALATWIGRQHGQ